MGEDYGKEEILIYLSYNDIDKESGGSAATYSNGSRNYIRTKSFSYTILNHETLHEWVSSFFTYDLALNNGHWGFIERATRAFGSGCYHGVFQGFSVDPSSGLVVGTS